jgi:hypothetical protein
MPICTPKTTAAVDKEAANFSILWFSLPRAAPVPWVFVGDDEAEVADILCAFVRYASAICSINCAPWVGVVVMLAPLAASSRPWVRR